jgi:hypothetical protein
MDLPTIEKLRQQQAIVPLPSGAEGVQVTLEYPGPVPASTRAERKVWLCGHFQGVLRDLERSGLSVFTAPLETEISVSSQSLRATVPVEHLTQVKEQLAKTKHLLEIDTVHHAEAQR